MQKMSETLSIPAHSINYPFFFLNFPMAVLKAAQVIIARFYGKVFCKRPPGAITALSVKTTGFFPVSDWKKSLPDWLLR